MARPIEATPTLYGDDAQRLIDSLDNRCSNEEAERRMAWAKKAGDLMTRVPCEHKTTIPTWTADPPAWAPYVGSVVVVDRGTEIHLSIDMSAKYLEPALAEVDGNTIRLTFFTIGSSTVIWPEDPGAWTGATLPSVIIDMGRDMSGYEATATGGRYAFHVVALRPVAWLHDGVYVSAAGTK